MMCGERWLETGSPFKKMDKSDVVIGHIYKHSKTGNLYVVTDIANTNSDWPQYVVYVDTNRKTWARTISEFVEKFEVSKGFINQVGDDMSESQIEWLKAENSRLTKENEQLLKDLHRIDAARQAAVNQCAAMAERINELESIVCGGAVGERGDACMAIDGGNL